MINLILPNVLHETIVRTEVNHLCKISQAAFGTVKIQSGFDCSWGIVNPELKNELEDPEWWYMSIIPTTWEVEVNSPSKISARSYLISKLKD